LFGDANTDYHDYFGTGKKNMVPVHLSSTSQLGLTPDDNWYVAFGSDQLIPDMLLGRIPGNNSSMVARMVSKIINYEGSAYLPKKALFVAENGDPAFEATDQTLIGYLPSGYEADKVYLSSYTNVSNATQDIISHINGGMLLTNYVGHGDVTHWTGAGLFDPTEIPLLNNGQRLTFVITLDCLNGYFSQPYYYCLGEDFAIAQGKGAIASFSPSDLGQNWEHEILGDNVFASIFQQKKTILGAITTQAKIEAYAQGATEDLVRSFTLLGDPASRLNIAP
jgi:hypothetical protein